MARYNITIKSSAARELESLPTKKLRRQIVERIRALADDPRPAGCEKLAGRTAHYRVRQGGYRILYRIEDAVLIVEVIAVGHRREVYR